MWASSCSAGGPSIRVITTTSRRAVPTDPTRPGVGRPDDSHFRLVPVGAALGAVVGVRIYIDICMLVAAAGFLIEFGVIVVSSVPQVRHLPHAA